MEDPPWRYEVLLQDKPSVANYLTKYTSAFVQALDCGRGEPSPSKSGMHTKPNTFAGTESGKT